MDYIIEFLTALPQKNKGKRDRGYYYNQRQRIIKKRMCIARRNGINIPPGKLSKSSVFCMGKGRKCNAINRNMRELDGL